MRDFITLFQTKMNLIKETIASLSLERKRFIHQLGEEVLMTLPNSEDYSVEDIERLGGIAFANLGKGKKQETPSNLSMDNAFFNELIMQLTPFDVDAQEARNPYRLFQVESPLAEKEGNFCEKMNIIPFHGL